MPALCRTGAATTRWQQEIWRRRKILGRSLAGSLLLAVCPPLFLPGAWGFGTAIVGFGVGGLAAGALGVLAAARRRYSPLAEPSLSGVRQSGCYFRRSVAAAWRPKVATASAGGGRRNRRRVQRQAAQAAARGTACRPRLATLEPRSTAASIAARSPRYGKREWVRRERARRRTSECAPI